MRFGHDFLSRNTSDGPSPRPGFGADALQPADLVQPADVPQHRGDIGATTADGRLVYLMYFTAA